MQSVRFESTAEALETLRLATEATGLGIWERNLRTGELRWSERCRAICGLEPGTPLSFESFLSLVHTDDRDRVQRTVQTALDPGGAGQYEMECRICRPTGEVRWVAIKGTCLFEESDGQRVGTRFLGTMMDKTEYKASQHALLQAEHLAATGRLAASIAHEINNPLEAVTNLLYLGRREKDEEQREEFLTSAEAELARVSEITANTLRFYRDPVGITKVHVPCLIRSVLSLFHGRLAIKKIALSQKLDDGVWLTTAQGEVRQVMVNLISNAIDAMPDGGRLEVQCRRLSSALDPRRTGALVFIADTGLGMTKEVQTRIFEPFYTTKGSAGTGLGLWLSLDLLRKHGYHLHLRSKPGIGSVFGVFMPAGPSKDSMQV